MFEDIRQQLPLKILLSLTDQHILKQSIFTEDLKPWSRKINRRMKLKEKFDLSMVERFFLLKKNGWSKIEYRCRTNNIKNEGWWNQLLKKKITQYIEIS